MGNKNVGAELSIIVPIGGAKPNLGNLLKWLEVALLANIEIVTIFDTDDSNAPEQIIRLQSQFPNLVASASTFRNPGSTRNIGIELSSRKWIAFADADDVVIIPALLKMLEECLEGGKSIAVGQFLRITSKEDVIIKRDINFPQYSLSEVSSSPGLWRFIFRRDRVGSTRFPKLSMAEDQIFISELFLKDEEIYFSSIYTYEYHLGISGQLTSTSKSPLNLQEALMYLESLESRYTEFGKQILIRNWITALKIGKPNLKLNLFVRYLRTVLEHPIRQLILLIQVIKLQIRIIQWKKKETVIILTGGLGNQLFQVAMASSLLKYGRVTLDLSTGKPRLNSQSNPEILSFQIPSELNLKFFSKSMIRQKSLGFILRSSYSPRWFEVNRTLMIPAKLISNTINSFYDRRITRVLSPKNLGWDPAFFNRMGKNQTVYGYFQSSNFSKTYPDMLEIKLNIESEELLTFKKLAEVEKPLVLHVRLGDYRTEDSFGILSPEYYSMAIDAACSKIAFENLWIFSDEPNTVLDFIRGPEKLNIRVIPNVGNSSAETLELMRSGKGFIIGNSSFSWWGAHLRHDRNAPVFAPDPWFKGKIQPSEIVPEDWIKIDSSYIG